MGGEEQRSGCEGQLMRLANMAERIHANCSHHHSRHQVRLGGETH
jgi:hypothetical protein